MLAGDKAFAIWLRAGIVLALLAAAALPMAFQ